MCGRRKSLRKSGSGKIQQQFEKLCRNQVKSQVLCQSRFSVNFGWFWDLFWKAKSDPNPSWKPSWEPEWFQSCPKFKLKGAQDGIATDRPIIRSKSRSKTSFILGPVFGRFQVQFRPTPRPHWQSKPTSVTGTAELNIRTAWTAPADGVQTQAAKYLWCFCTGSEMNHFWSLFWSILEPKIGQKRAPKWWKIDSTCASSMNGFQSDFECMFGSIFQRTRYHVSYCPPDGNPVKHYGFLTYLFLRWYDPRSRGWYMFFCVNLVTPQNGAKTCQTQTKNHVQKSI